MVYTSGIKGLTDPTELKKVTYQWKLYKAEEMDKKGPVHQIAEDKWMPVLDFDEMLYTPANASTISIKEKMLMSQYRYKVRVYTSYNGQEGFAEDSLYMNQPPAGGNCSIGKCAARLLVTLSVSLLLLLFLHR